MNLLYGISNCDSVKKAQQWLNAQHIDYQFIDFKKTPPDATLLQHWLKQHELVAFINKRSTTWRNLSAQAQAQIDNSETALALLSAHPTLIKRPILDSNGKIIIGFSAQQYEHHFHQR